MVHLVAVYGLGLRNVNSEGMAASLEVAELHFFRNDVSAGTPVGA